MGRVLKDLHIDIYAARYIYNKNILKRMRERITMELLIVRDESRMPGNMKTFKQYDEEGIKTTVCSSNILTQMPSMEFDLIVVDLIKDTIENKNFSFLQGLENQRYKAVIAIADQCSKSEEVRRDLQNFGVYSYLERPLTKEIFFEEMDQALQFYQPQMN